MSDSTTPIISESKMPMITYVLYLIGTVLPFLTLAGLILAYLNRGDAPDWHKSHYTYLIRTFWIGLFFTLIGMVLAIVGVGVLIIFAVAIWYLIRTVKGLLAFNKGRPVLNPTTWWF